MSLSIETKTIYEHRMRLIREDHERLTRLLNDREGEGMATWIVCVCEAIRGLADTIDGKRDG